MVGENEEAARNLDEMAQLINRAIQLMERDKQDIKRINKDIDDTLTDLLHAQYRIKVLFERWNKEKSGRPAS